MIFDFFSVIFEEWIDWQDPKSSKFNKQKDNKVEPIITFPYYKNLQKKKFQSMSFQQKFDMCFQGVVNDEVPEDTDEFDLQQMPYRLVFKNISGY